MFKLNSQCYVREVPRGYRLIKADNPSLIQEINSSLKSISDNLEFLDETKTSKEDTLKFVLFVQEEVEKIKRPYEDAIENVKSMELYLKDLLQKVENFLNYNMKIEDTGLHGIV